MQASEFKGARVLLPHSMRELNGDYVHVRSTKVVGDVVYGDVYVLRDKYRVPVVVTFELSRAGRKTISGTSYVDCSNLESVEPHVLRTAFAREPRACATWSVTLTERGTDRGETLRVTAVSPNSAEYEARTLWASARKVSLNDCYKRMKATKVERE